MVGDGKLLLAVSTRLRQGYGEASRKHKNTKNTKTPSYVTMRVTTAGTGRKHREDSIVPPKRAVES